MATLLANALRDFGVPPARNMPLAPPPPRAEREPELPRGPSAAELEAQRIASAVAEAEARVVAELEERHAAEMEAERAAHAAELERLADRLGENAAAEIATRLESLDDRLVELTSSVAARLLGVVVTEDVNRRAIEALAQTIRAAVGDKEAVSIRVAGPISLREQLGARLGNLAERIVYTEAAGFDLTVAIDDQVYETRLAEWAEALEEAVA